mmetsp:Transcript_26553/g.79624  ORF Transcript_26553/g.79624 Transcript_26553/m.79624 type:complete len:109 (+) Transcript_26553:233-559(+)
MSGYGSMEPATETDRLLDDSLAQSAKTEELGAATLDRMRAQREGLESAAGRAGDTRRVTAEAKGTIRDIALNVLKEKVVLAFIILFLIGVDGGLAYLLVQNGGSFMKK